MTDTWQKDPRPAIVVENRPQGDMTGLWKRFDSLDDVPSGKLPFTDRKMIVRGFEFYPQSTIAVQRWEELGQ